jgi:hypothetical protein
MPLLMELARFLSGEATNIVLLTEQQPGIGGHDTEASALRSLSPRKFLLQNGMDGLA